MRSAEIRRASEAEGGLEIAEASTHRDFVGARLEAATAAHTSAEDMSAEASIETPRDERQKVGRLAKSAAQDTNGRKGMPTSVHALIEPPSSSEHEDEEATSASRLTSTRGGVAWVSGAVARVVGVGACAAAEGGAGGAAGGRSGGRIGWGVGGAAFPSTQSEESAFSRRLSLETCATCQTCASPMLPPPRELFDFHLEDDPLAAPPRSAREMLIPPPIHIVDQPPTPEPLRPDPNLAALISRLAAADAMRIRQESGGGGRIDGGMDGGIGFGVEVEDGGAVEGAGGAVDGGQVDAGEVDGGEVDAGGRGGGSGGGGGSRGGSRGGVHCEYMNHLVYDAYAPIDLSKNPFAHPAQVETLTDPIPLRCPYKSVSK